MTFIGIKQTFIGLIVMSSVFVSVALSIPAQAQSNGAAQGIEISPALVDLNAERGQTYTVKLKVTNVTAATLVYTSEVNDFTSKDESGAPQILIGENLPTSASVVDWVTTEQEFTLQSRESRTIVASITIPDDAEPGGHYGAIRFSGRTPELQETGVGLSASAGMLMLIRVSGDINESANVASFFTANGDTQSFFFETSPVKFVTRIKNDGNIHVKPIGSIELRDMFGNIVSTIPVNDSKSNVLPNSIRKFENEYKSDWMFGLYTANLTLGYGTTGQAITNSITFWVIPYKLVLIVLLALVTLVFIVRRLLKVYNRRIIEKAKHEFNAKTKTKNTTTKKKR